MSLYLVVNVLETEYIVEVNPFIRDEEKSLVEMGNSARYFEASGKLLKENVTFTNVLTSDIGSLLKEAQEKDIYVNFGKNPIMGNPRYRVMEFGTTLDEKGRYVMQAGRNFRIKIHHYQ